MTARMAYATLNNWMGEGGGRDEQGGVSKSADKVLRFYNDAIK